MRVLRRMRRGDDCSGSNWVANFRECLIIGIVICHVVRDDTLRSCLQALINLPSNYFSGSPLSNHLLALLIQLKLALCAVLSGCLRVLLPCWYAHGWSTNIPFLMGLYRRLMRASWPSTSISVTRLSRPLGWGLTRPTHHPVVVDGGGTRTGLAIWDDSLRW
jgi:hypothetical protein